MKAMKNMAEYRNKYYPLLTKPYFFLIRKKMSIFAEANIRNSVLYGSEKKNLTRRLSIPNGQRISSSFFS